MSLLEELDARGLVADVSDRETLGKLLDDRANPITFYAGYDPTAISLHAGNLVPLSLAARLARAGHKMIALVGGATGVVGDPSGKSSERKLLDRSTLATNVEALRKQITRFVSADALMVNNADWFGGIGYLDFLRDVGKHITVNYMLAKESVRARLEDRDQGISYTEFSYMLLQGYDYVHLARAHDCRLQIGGADQWGNITCGTELYRKMGGAKNDSSQLFALTAPLLLNAAGAKFGKSEGKNVWLDTSLTSEYEFYQFWINTDDADVGKYLRMFTFRSLADIAELIAAHDVDRGKRLAQKQLALDVTAWVHGADAAAAAKDKSERQFGKGENLAPDSTAALSRLDGAGIALIDLLVETGLADSKGAARRLIQGGGAYLNQQQMKDIARTVTPADLSADGLVVLRAGKTKIHVIKFQ